MIANRRLDALIVPAHDAIVDRGRGSQQVATIEQGNRKPVEQPDQQRMRNGVPVERMLGTEQQRHVSVERAMRQHVDPIRRRHPRHQLGEEFLRRNENGMAARGERLHEFARDDVRERVSLRHRLDVTVG